MTPFPGFTGEVRVAAGDFTGDGIADLVVGTGPGRSTRVRVLNGANQAELFAVDPFEAGFTGGVFVAVGDMNGDGKADLAISPDEGGGPRVRLFTGSGFTPIADFFGIDDPQFRGGARVSFADITADGKSDLIVAAGTGGGPRIALYNGTTVSGTGGTRIVPDFFLFEQTLRNGTFVTGGDLDGDGYAELISGGGPGGAPRVVALNGKDLALGQVPAQRANFFAGDPYDRSGVRVTIKNLDNDSQADLVVGAGNSARIRAYAGKSIASTGTPGELLALDFPAGAGGVFVG